MEIDRGAEKFCLQAAQKDSEAKRAKNRSFGSAQDRLGGGVLFLYVDAKSKERNEAYEAFSAVCSQRSLQ
jgi:hypothetical protein